MFKKVKNNVYWVGKIDWELEWFHGHDYSINKGSSQNAYLIREEKTVLVDTVWAPHKNEFVDNLKKEIDLKDIDYIIAQHGEVDHSGSLEAIVSEIPDVPIYCTANCVKSLVGQYHHPEWNFHVVKTGDELDIGNGKKLQFIEMRMLHWPDSMATFMTGDNILFSMDVFGQHYAVEEMFDDKANNCDMWSEAMKYFANIIHTFAPMCKMKMSELDKMNLPIELICPSHGAIWRSQIPEIIKAYKDWSDNYQENQITVIYDTMWDGTKKLAHRIAQTLKKESPDSVVKIYNISQFDKNDIMTEVFKSKAIAVGSPTVAQNMLSSVGGWMEFLKECRFKGKKAAVFGCYGWSGEACDILSKHLTESGFEVIETQAKCNWNPDEENFEAADKLAKDLVATCK